MKIYIANKGQVPIRKALNIITEEWYNDGQCCGQTVLDLVEACKEMLPEEEYREPTLDDIGQLIQVWDEEGWKWRTLVGICERQFYCMHRDENDIENPNFATAWKEARV